MLHTFKPGFRSSSALPLVYAKATVRVQPKAAVPPDDSSVKNKRVDQALDAAEMCIDNYCKSLSGQDKNQCELALEEFKNRRYEAETQCKLSEDPANDTHSCQELEQMEDLARQVGFSGKDLATISSHFQVPPPEAEPAAAATKGEEGSHGISESRKRLLNVFQENDGNKDGYLDVEELRCALRELGHYITGQEIVMILEAFGSEFGYMIDYEEFEAIAESDLMNDDQEARMLTHRNCPNVATDAGERHHFID